MLCEIYGMYTSIAIHVRAALVSGYKDTEEFSGALVPWLLVSGYIDTRQKSSVGRVM